MIIREHWEFIGQTKFQNGKISLVLIVDTSVKYIFTCKINGCPLSLVLVESCFMPIPKATILSTHLSNVSESRAPLFFFDNFCFRNCISIKGPDKVKDLDMISSSFKASVVFSSFTPASSVTNCKKNDCCWNPIYKLDLSFHYQVAQII